MAPNQGWLSGLVGRLGGAEKLGQFGSDIAGKLGSPAARGLQLGSQFTTGLQKFRDWRNQRKAGQEAFGQGPGMDQAVLGNPAAKLRELSAQAPPPPTVKTGAPVAPAAPRPAMPPGGGFTTGGNMALPGGGGAGLGMGPLKPPAQPKLPEDMFTTGGNMWQG